ncbi:MAG: hypothetical protein TR69_WS6001001072 [candidate division WS6 bacterium OLB20]|uniref:Tetratricopeptide repeat protein n=1 Tax=candidate division WS6 bacterium OLB20 TaxID=1617426 RepID=A0A136LZJ6_9BACT|nr:MAG: hypothetical protein TR69_WS6001001072 [candidate division WS6 bacterium OLB20]
MSILSRLKPSRNVAAMLMVSLVVALLVLAYMFLVGIPMTQARNAYNKAQIAYERGDYDDSREYLDESLSIWDTQEARELQDMLKDVQNSSE